MRARSEWVDACVRSGLEVVSISDVFYSQTRCSSTFKNEKPIQDLVDALMSNKQDPLHDDSLIINVCKVSGWMHACAEWMSGGVRGWVHACAE